MQWSAEKNAGFTTADKPWFEVNANYPEINVAAAEADPNSLLHYYRKLLQFRKDNEIVRYGDFKMLKTQKEVFAYVRTYKGQQMLVVNSFSSQVQPFRAPETFEMCEDEQVLGNYEQCAVVHNGCLLRPYETRVYLKKA